MLLRRNVVVVQNNPVRWRGSRRAVGPIRTDSCVDAHVTYFGTHPFRPSFTAI